MARLISSALLTVCFAVIASAQPSPRVELIVQLREFSENSGFMRFADRTETTYHSSSFEVLGPDEYCGKSLTVFHEQVPEPGSAWRQVGRVSRLSVSADVVRDLFEPSHMVFSPTAEIVEEVDPKDLSGLQACGDR